MIPGPEKNPQTPASRRQRIRAAALNQTLGKWVRVLDLLLEHHTDEGKAVEDEAMLIAKKAAILMVGHLLDETDAVLLLESSKLKLPRKLEESSAHDIRRWIDGTLDDEDHPDLKLKRDPRPSED